MVRTLAGTTLADSMAGTAGSTEAAGITEFAELLAQPILIVAGPLHDLSAKGKQCP
jgi:hypothetical protein